MESIHLMETDKNKNIAMERSVSIAIAAAALMQMSHGGVTPALEAIGQSFPNATDTTLALLNTMPVLTSIPSTFVAGRLAGKKFSFRTLMLTGLGFLLIGGLVAFFCQSIEAVLLCRAVFGIGLGIIAPMVSAFTLCIFPDEQANKQLALNTVAANFGSILFQLTGGYLCLLGWRYTFLCYLIVLLPIGIIYTIIKPSYGKVEDNKAQQSEQSKKMNLKKVALWCGIYISFFIAFYVFVNNMSWVIVSNGYGASADVAWVLSVFNIGGLCGGALYRKHLFKLGPYVFLTALLLCGMGFGCVILAKELWVLYGASILFGGGFGIFVPAAMYYGGTSVEAAQRSTMVSYMSIANNLGGFSSAYLLSAACALLGLEGRIMHFYLGIGVFSIVVGILLVWGLKEKDKRTDT